MKFLIAIILSIPFWGLTTTKIIGSAEGHSEEWVHLYEIDEFVTKSETFVQRCKTTQNNEFFFEIENKAIKRYIIRINDSYTELYIQPNSSYQIIIPKESIEVIPYFSGKEIELLFLELDTNDINYKILGFEAWLDDEMSSLYLLKDAEPSRFIDGVLKFKMEILEAYRKDTSSYFKTHIKYVLGKTIDNINYFGGPNVSEKFLFYIKNQEVHYDMPAYIDYFRDFYRGVANKLSPASKRVVSLGIIEADCQLMLRGLLADSIVPSPQIAEMVALQVIEEAYPSGRVSQNSLIEITRYIQNNSKFNKHRLIARNMLLKFYELIAGDPIPKIEISSKIALGSNLKPQYIHFFDPGNPKSLAETQALNTLYKKYGRKIEFISIYLNKKVKNEGFKQRVLDNLSWPSFELAYYHPIWKALNVGSFPYYVLINDDQTIHSMPALGPIPNGQYETISKTFFEIQK